MYVQTSTDNCNYTYEIVNAMQVHDDFSNQEEKIMFYYARYYWELIIGRVSIEELVEYIKILEATEEYEGAAGIQRALNDYINKAYE